jgi:hypothetical protein
MLLYLTSRWFREHIDADASMPYALSDIAVTSSQSTRPTTSLSSTRPGPCLSIMSPVENRYPPFTPRRPSEWIFLISRSRSCTSPSTPSYFRFSGDCGAGAAPPVSRCSTERMRSLSTHYAVLKRK